MTSGVKLGDIGGNAIVTVVTGTQTQTDTHVGHNIRPINPHDADALQQLLTDILWAADAQHEISKQRYAELSQAVDQIRAELQKKQNPDTTILSKAKSVLEGFKTVEGIATSIEKTLTLIAKFLI